MPRAKELLLKVAGGQVAVETFVSEERPTPIAYNILYKYLEVPELVAPDSLAKTTVEKMKLSIYGTSVELLCMKCGEGQGHAAIGELAEEPRCKKCGSGLLTPSFWDSGKVSGSSRRKLAQERRGLAQRRRGRRARKGAAEAPTLCSRTGGGP